MASICKITLDVSKESGLFYGMTWWR